MIGYYSVMDLVHIVFYGTLLVFLVDVLGLLYYYIRYRVIVSVLYTSVLGFVLVPSFMLFLCGYLVQYVDYLDINGMLKTSVVLNFTLVLLYSVLVYLYEKRFVL